MIIMFQRTLNFRLLVVISPNHSFVACVRDTNKSRMSMNYGNKMMNEFDNMIPMQYKLWKQVLGSENGA